MGSLFWELYPPSWFTKLPTRQIVQLTKNAGSAKATAQPTTSAGAGSSVARTTARPSTTRLRRPPTVAHDQAFVEPDGAARGIGVAWARATATGTTIARRGSSVARTTAETLTPGPGKRLTAASRRNKILFTVS